MDLKGGRPRLHPDGQAQHHCREVVPTQAPRCLVSPGNIRSPTVGNAVVAGRQTAAQTSPERAARLLGDHMAVDLGGQLLDTSGQLLRDLREPGILIEQLLQLHCLLCREFLSLDARTREILAVSCVGVGVCLVAIRLTSLRQQDQGSGIGGLEAEGEIEQNEGVEVELGEAYDVEANPDGHNDRLPHQKNRRAEEAGKALRLGPEPTVAERRREMRMRRVKAEVSIGLR